MQTPPQSTLSALLQLLRPFRLVLITSIVLGILGGLGITALLATINNSLHAEGDTSTTLLLGFAGLCVLALVGSILSDIGTNYVVSTSSPDCAKNSAHGSYRRPSNNLNATAAID